MSKNAYEYKNDFYYSFTKNDIIRIMYAVDNRNVCYRSMSRFVDGTTNVFSDTLIELQEQEKDIIKLVNKNKLNKWYLIDMLKQYANAYA